MKWVSKRSEFSEGTNRSRNQEDGGPRGRSDRQDMNLPTIKPEEGQKPIQEKAERCQQRNSWTKRLASCLHVPKNEDKLKNSSWINEAILLRTQLHKIKPACPWQATLLIQKALQGPEWWPLIRLLPIDYLSWSCFFPSFVVRFPSSQGPQLFSLDLLLDKNAFGISCLPLPPLPLPAMSSLPHHFSPSFLLSSLIESPSSNV